jgi:amidase
VVQREKEAAAIIVGKTNVPEFGLGWQTFNPVFGATHNPYDVTQTCGGSIGGGAVALACGMVPLECRSWGVTTTIGVSSSWAVHSS